MRHTLLFIASAASLIGTLLLIAMGLGMLVKGNAGYALGLFFIATPCMVGLTIVFDYVRSRIALTDDPDLDVDIIKPKFTKFGGG